MKIHSKCAYLNNVNVQLCSEVSDIGMLSNGIRRQLSFKNQDNMFKKVLLSLLALLVVLIVIVLVKTFTFTSSQKPVAAQAAPALSEESVQRFQSALRYQTISYGDSNRLDTAQFNGFQRFLVKAYPGVHRVMKRTIVQGHSLIYTWEGKNPALAPYVLMAHQDVVPIEEASRSKWTVEPFGGTVKDGYLWGRGTTDDKINLISILEAAEKLISENVQPARTIYLAFGHDEEMGGRGAVAMAKWFTSRGIKAEFVLDEGGIITKEKIPGLTRPVALVGNAEKGYLTLNLTVEKSGGHSSMPEKETAIDVLTHAIDRLRDQPFPARFTPSMTGLMEAVGPDLPFTSKMAFANPWLFKSLIISTYEKSGPGAAMLHTTLVPTIIQAGIKDNVVPSVAKATINLRLLPGDNSEEVIARVKTIINDERVQIQHSGPLSEASPVSPMEGPAFAKIDGALKQSYSNVITSPFLVIGATDSRHFTGVSTNIYKFSPMVDPIGFHGIDERVSLEGYQTAIFFFTNLLRNAE